MVFTFSNQKGGVGKTTTVLNLGAILAEKGKKVLLVDLDPQANLTSGLGMKKIDEEKTESIYDVLLNNKNISEVFISTQIKNLFLVPSNIDLAGAEIELVGKISRETILKEQIKKIEDQYDYVFIDCPPSLGLLTINALVAANKVIIPIQCEYFALEGLSQLVNTINLIKRGLNRGLLIGGVILTMYDARTKLSKAIEEDVKKHFSAKVFDTLIPRNVTLSESPSFGEPISVYDRNALGFVAYHKLAHEFISRFDG